MSDELVIPVFCQDPEAKLDYDFNLVSSDADTWASYGTPVVSPTGPTVTVALSGALAKVWFTGGTDEQDYDVRVPLTSTAGRVDQVRFIVQVRR